MTGTTSLIFTQRKDLSNDTTEKQKIGSGTYGAVYADRDSRFAIKVVDAFLVDQLCELHIVRCQIASEKAKNAFAAQLFASRFLD